MQRQVPAVGEDRVPVLSFDEFRRRMPLDLPTLMTAVTIIAIIVIVAGFIVIGCGGGKIGSL